MSDPDAIDVFAEIDGVELIQRTPLFKSLGFDETRKLAELVRIERFARGDTIIEQDALGSALYILREGEVDILRTDAEGRAHSVNRLGPGELFGEMSLVDDMLVSADVCVASEAAEVLVIPRREFEELMEADDRFAARVYRAFCSTLATRLRTMSQRFADLESPG